MAPSIGTRLEDKVAIVTGASTGIGRAIAVLYAAQGAYVVCASRKPVPNEKLDDYDEKPTHDAINDLYPAPKDGRAAARAIFVKTDVSVAAEVENLVQECVRTFGRLDVMVNNAGIIPTQLDRIHELPESNWDSVMGINGKGTWLGCKYATGQMLAQEPHPSGDRGWIVNLTSVHGFVGTAAGTSSYVASKGAIVTLTKALALEYGKDKIHVNAVAPGYVKTPLTSFYLDPNSSDPVVRATNAELVQKHPFGPRLGTCDETARGALFLASEDAAFVSGHVLAVDGGFLAH